MGYILRAFIGKNNALDGIVRSYPTAKKVSFYQDLSMIPMTDMLFDEINKLSISHDMGSFMLFTEKVENEILNIIEMGQVAYIEAEYFGGIGSQSSIIWENKKRTNLFDKDPGAINLALKKL